MTNYRYTNPQNGSIIHTTKPYKSYEETRKHQNKDFSICVGFWCYPFLNKRLNHDNQHKCNIVKYNIIVNNNNILNLL